MSRRISRRTLLRGAGVAIGLPLLEAMDALGAADDKPPVRLMFVYKPGGFIMDAWKPEATLSPLEKLKDDVLLLGGLDSRNGDTGGNGHPAACAPWLSSAPINRKDKGGYCTDLSVDQIAARKIGESTRLASLEIGTNHNPSALHVSNISWRGPGSPMGKEVHPRAVFTRLFGDPKGDKYRRSVLDYVLDSAGGIRKSLGAADRNKVDEYLDSVRSIERRIQFIEKNAAPPPPKVEWLASVPEGGETPDPRRRGTGGTLPFGQHIRMLSELAALGFQADSTRVVTFMLENEDTIGPIPEIGVTEGHHGLAHHSGRPGRPPATKEDQEKVEGLKKMDRFFVEQFAFLLEKLKGLKEAGGSVLDNSLILFGSGLSWGNLHWRTDLPLVLAGKGGGRIRSGRSLRFPKDTPLPNLFLTMLDCAGVKADRIADSTGRLPIFA